MSKRVKGVVAAASIFVFAFVLIAPSAIAWEPAPTGAYSGRAYGLWVSTPLGGSTYADTGNLPPDGGASTATLDVVSTPAAEAGVFVSWTMGMNGVAESFASTSDVSLIPGNPSVVTASFVSASTQATCSGGPSGSSEISDLTVMGQPVTVTGEPNEIIAVPNGFTLVINEQSVWSDTTGSSITVNALHLWAQGVEIVVSSAHSDISCPAGSGTTFPPPPPHDFVTGGGWIWNNGFHANFGFVAGYKPGQTSLQGELNWVDHGTGDHIKATSVDTYSVGAGPGPGPARTFSGDATVDGNSGYHYTCTVQDNGEPGRNVDWIDFSVSGPNGFVYEAGGYLAGGNIQVHENP